MTEEKRGDVLANEAERLVDYIARAAKATGQGRPSVAGKYVTSMLDMAKFVQVSFLMPVWASDQYDMDELYKLAFEITGYKPAKGSTVTQQEAVRVLDDWIIAQMKAGKQ